MSDRVPPPPLGALADRVLVEDGAMGTLLQPADLALDDFAGREGCDEILDVTGPDIVRPVHRGCPDAGADAVETNTFGADLANLAEYGIAEKIVELCRRGAELAREVADECGGRFVLGSVGPGPTLPTLGHDPYATLWDACVEQVNGLLEGGVDAVIVKTSQDLLRTTAAIVGAKRVHVSDQVRLHRAGRAPGRPGAPGRALRGGLRGRRRPGLPVPADHAAGPRARRGGCPPRTPSATTPRCTR